MEQFANNASSTLSSGISSGATSLSVASASAFPSSGNFRILIDSEIFLVTAVSGTTFTVTGAQESTTAASHSSGTTVTHIVTAGGLIQAITDRAAMVLLEQHTASSSAELDFTSWYSSSYDEYVIELLNLLPATNATTLRLQWSTNNGSTYDSGSNYVDNSMAVAPSGFNHSAHTTATSHPLNLYDNDAPVSNDSTHGGVSASFRLINPAGSLYKNMFGTANYWSSGSTYIITTGGLFYLSTSAVNAFKIFSSSGNLTSGTVRIYGLRK